MKRRVAFDIFGALLDMFGRISSSVHTQILEISEILSLYDACQ